MNRELTVTAGGRNYTVKYPNVGQLIDIATRESNLSRGAIKDLMFSGLADQQDAYVYIKVIAFVEVMLPKLIDDLKVETLLELAPEDFQQLTQVYLKDILVWLNAWKEKMQKPQEEK